MENTMISQRIRHYRRMAKMSQEELLSVKGSAELAFRAGQKVKIVDGDEDNFKITTPADLERFKQIVAGRMSEER